MDKYSNAALIFNNGAMVKTILLVDDSATLRSAAVYALERSGHKVIQAVDGMDGLDKIEDMEARNTKLNMMIVDVNMPNLDGISFIKEVKKTSYKDVPILVLTTESQYDMKMEGKVAGATGWLVKPFKNRQLVEVVDMLAN
jgi:two-component system chemotaxis response regulator CheY